MSVSERLGGKVRELSALILKSEHPSPSRALVDPLLELLVGGPFDLKEKFLIQEPGVIPLLLELLPSLPEDLQLELWSTLSVILHRSLWNIQTCRQLQLIQRCLDYLSKTNSIKVANHVSKVVETLGGYSLSVKELKAIVSHLYTGQDKKWSPHAVPLIGALYNMSVNLQPEVFFNFSGQQGAALTLPPISKWPTQSGFTFTTWLRVEKPYDSQRDYYKPVVYWFRTGKGFGYAAHFIGSTLVLETSGRGHKKPQTHAVEFVFQSYQWYMLTVVYTHHRLKSSELCCYISGKPVLSTEVSLPTTDDVYDKCFLGTSPASTPDTIFQGQMSAIYLFRDPLNHETISALQKLGPGYKSQFKFDAESDVPLTASEKKVLFDGQLASVVIFSYNAKAVDGRLCLEASPLENRSCFAHSPHATLLEGVEPVTTTPFHSALHSLGGMQALYPLFSQLDLPQTSSGNAVDYNLSVKLLSLVFEMAHNSTSFMLQLVQTKGVEFISYLLEKVSPKHLSRELVSCIFNFVRYLSVAPSGSELLFQLIEHLVFNAGLWSRAEQGVQLQLYSQVATEFSMHPLGTSGLDLREFVGVSQLLFILREYYGLTEEGAEVHAKVRPYLLLIVKNFVTKGKGIYSKELKSILSYLCTVPEEESLHDVLRLLLALVFEDPTTSHIIKTFEELDGLNVAMKLLAFSSEELTLNALKLIGKVLHHSNTKHQHYLIDSVGLFSVLREKLLSAGQPMSTAMFNTLFEIFVNCPSRRIIDGHYLALDLSHQIQFPGILAVMIELICMLHTAPSEWEESDTLMRMQLFSYVSSLCAQHLRNCRAILRLRHWQHWLLVLSDQQGATESDCSHLEEMVFKLLLSLLLHCFQEEQDGWRVWVETAAIMHAYNVTKAEGGAPLLPSSNLEGLSVSCFASFAEFHSSSDSSSFERIREELALPEKDDDIVELPGNSPLPHAGSVEGRTDGEEEGATSDASNSQVSPTSQINHGTSAETERERNSLKTAFADRTADTLQVSESEEDSLQSLKETQKDDPPSPLPGDSPDTRAARKPRFPKSKPLPLTRVATPPFSRTSSGEYPSSPFLIPRNPFLVAEGKMAKFQWSSSHVRLLEDLLKSLQKIMGRWRSGSPEKKRPSLADRIGEDSNRHLRSNVAHLLALTTDNIVAMNGGLKRLLARSTTSKPKEFKPSDSIRASHAPSLRYTLTSDPARAEALLQTNLSLADVIVLSGLLKMSPVEAKMKMEGGGVLRQGLRLVLAGASQLISKANTEHRYRHENYHREKQVAEQLHQESVAMATSLGLEGSALVKYFHSSLEKKLEYLNSCQRLLTGEFLTHLWNLIPREGENKQAVQQLVVAEVYYLAVMCVAKYGSILDTTGKEERDTGPESTVSLGGSEYGNVIAEAAQAGYQKTVSTSSAESVPSTPEFDKALSFATRMEQSVLPSAFAPYVLITDVSDQVEVTLKLVGPFLCRLLLEHKTMLSKVFLAADGRQLLTDAALRLAENNSIVEMTMLLCSQEWQGSLQKYGGKAFNDLLLEGRRVATFCETYLHSVASKTTTDFQQSAETQTNKFTQFEEQLSLFLSQAIRSSSDDLQLMRAEVKRHAFSAKETWRKISSVMDEYGSPDFTPAKCCRLWKLDLRENASRQRVKLLPNPHGSQHEEAVRRAQPDLEETEEEEGEGVVGVVAPPTQDLMVGGEEEDSIVSEELSESVIAVELAAEQDQAFQLKCQLVVLGRPLSGTLTLTPHSLTFTADDSTEEYAKAAYLAEYCSINERWLLEEVRAVFLRRYLHQSKALEIFFAYRSSVFFVFENLKEVKTVVRRLPKVGVGTEYGLPQSRSMSLASPQQLFKKSAMTARWERREISNFEYLMFLNTIAGRSYNNLNQYPVFPWILTDYTSKTLDLSDPSIYRDLSKPIGTLNPTRLEKLEERFSCWDDDRVPPFLYGTHYSTMAFVLHWMVRLEPFSTLHINFHDGFFDQGSRLFYCLQESWCNCLDSTSDVKELIPEFFYLPEMFLNENKFDLGKEGACEEGDVINDVTLPPWASSAHDFIRVHREALESEYVSAHLHNWIDLIFGYKQRGEEALKAKNVFYYLTYTGTIDLESISDPKMRKGLEDQIRHFGQCPAQLLKEPHPARQSAATEELLLQPTVVPDPKTPAVVAWLQVTPDVPLALVQLSASPSPSVLAVSYNQLYAMNKWSITAGTSPQSQVVSLEPDPQLASGLRVRLGEPLDQSISASAACFAATPGNEVILVCGFWDNSFKCFAANSSQLVQSLFGHRDIVSCLDFSTERGIHGNPGDGLVATGSHDATVLLWRWSGRQNRVVGLVAGEEVDSPAPIAVLTGHEQSIACVSVDCSLGLTVSGAKYGSCLVHSNSGELLHKLVPSFQWVHPHMIDIMRDGRIVVHYADQKGCLAIFSCNERQLCHCQLGDPALAMTVSKDDWHIITGGFNCRVKVFSAHNLTLKHAYEPFESSIRSLHISEDKRFIFAGLASGSIAVLATHMWLH